MDFDFDDELRLQRLEADIREMKLKLNVEMDTTIELVRFCVNFCNELEETGSPVIAGRIRNKVRDILDRRKKALI